MKPSVLERDSFHGPAGRPLQAGSARGPPYDRSMGFPAPWLIALVLLCFVLAAIPARRLFLAGIRPAWLWAYVLLLVGLGVAAIAARGAGRFLVPFLVVLYVAPLVVGPDTIARRLRRGRKPPRNVGSGPGSDVGPDDPSTP
jgi:hypothetical protein